MGKGGRGVQEEGVWRIEREGGMGRGDVGIVEWGEEMWG